MHVNDPFLMRCVCYDSVLMEEGKVVYNFFEDKDDVEGSRADNMEEAALIQWFFQHYLNVKQIFYEELQLSGSYNAFFQVRYPVVLDGKMPGDIDILMVDPVLPHLSIGIQAKRIKGVRGDDDITRLKHSPIPKGVRQSVKMLDKYRFHQNYFMMIIVHDGQAKKR